MLDLIFSIFINVKIFYNYKIVNKLSYVKMVGKHKSMCERSVKGHRKQ